LTFAENFFNESYIERGADIYAKNCANCHGPLGEGVVGPALNREDLRGNPSDKSDVYDMLVTTISRGRPGSPSPKWVRLPDGSWASYTAMPKWLNEEGGPLNDQGVKQVAMFIMMGDFKDVSSHIPPANVDEGFQYVTLDE